jgi:hypothetical protein
MSELRMGQNTLEFVNNSLGILGIFSLLCGHSFLVVDLMMGFKMKFLMEGKHVRGRHVIIHHMSSIYLDFLKHVLSSWVQLEQL